MKKSHAFSDLSDKVCANPNCDRRLKKRIVEAKPEATLCYRCFRTAQGRPPKKKKVAAPGPRAVVPSRREKQSIRRMIDEESTKI